MANHQTRPLLAVLDSIATTNAGSVTQHGHEYILVARADWTALMEARGTPEQVLARMGSVNEGPAGRHKPTEDEVFAACRRLGIEI